MYSDAENLKRKGIVERAVHDASEAAQSVGFSPSGEDLQEIQERLALELPGLVQSTSTEALDLMVCALVVDIIVEVCNQAAPRTDTGRKRLGVAVMKLIGQRIAEHLATGAFVIDEERHRQLCKALGSHVSKLMTSGADIAACRERALQLADAAMPVYFDATPSKLN